jgi:hypothetical protein
MLDLTHEPCVSDLSWDTVELSARIPASMPDFFERKGPTPVRAPDRRAFRRFYLRSKAILRSDDKFLGVYTVDASRKGIRIFSPLQLLPKLHVWLRMPGIQEFEVEIVRCCRLEERCYDCGAIFIRGI